MDAYETKLRQKLARQQTAIEQTKKEIAYYEAAVTEHPRAVALVTAGQTKLRRQLEAVKTTELAIELYLTPPAKTKR